MIFFWQIPLAGLIEEHLDLGSTKQVASDCRSRGCELNPGPFSYFCGDYEIYSTVILLLLVGVSYKRKYLQEVLVNHLAKLAQEIVWLG